MITTPCIRLTLQSLKHKCCHLPCCHVVTSLTVVYSTVYSDADQRKHQSSASLAFVWGIHRDLWIPRTKGQLRGKCFHLMTSSCTGWKCDISMGYCDLNWEWRITYEAKVTNFHRYTDVSDFSGCGDLFLRSWKFGRSRGSHLLDPMSHG